MIYKITLKFTGKGKGIKITKTVLIKKNAVGGFEDLLYAAISALKISDSKTYYMQLPSSRLLCIDEGIDT